METKHRETDEQPPQLYRPSIPLGYGTALMLVPLNIFEKSPKFNFHVRRQAITWTNADLLSIEPLAINLVQFESK